MEAECFPTFEHAPKAGPLRCHESEEDTEGRDAMLDYLLEWSHHDINVGGNNDYFSAKEF
jgi:hypothetical protein